jgi:23S rRNA (adenine2503-C2)-methyltransferase
MPNRKDLVALSIQEMELFAGEQGLEPYRARQISQWIFQKHIREIGLMTNLSKELRTRLEGVAFISSFTPERIDSSADGSRKYLFRAADDLGIESVLIPEPGHVTLCISTQLGCPMGCRFCHTGRGGLVRNLTVAEILNQVRAIMLLEPFGESMPNLVFMGMGEPLANYDNTVRAIRMLLSPWGFNFSHRRITVSTAGLVPQMKRLGEDVPVNLAISLNASNDETRSRLMPLNNKFPIHELLAAARQFPLAARKRITFEYILIKDVNDAAVNARELAGLLKGIPCKINLIPFNEHPAVDFKKPSERSVIAFQKILHDLNFTAPIRHSKGSDIAAACGQLGAQPGITEKPRAD